MIFIAERSAEQREGNRGREKGRKRDLLGSELEQIIFPAFRTVKMNPNITYN